MSPTLAQWNTLSVTEAIASLIPCCASTRWAATLAAQRPFTSDQEFLDAADSGWSALDTADCLEAFSAHPRIGETTAPHASAASLAWSRQEQSRTATAAPSTLEALANLNQAYESRHGFTCIICATGKSPEEMLEILRRRLRNETAAEILEAAEQQRQITRLRLQKWLSR